MRAIVAAITLVFAIGAVMPTDVEARAPRELQTWGCTIRAVFLDYDDLLNRVYGRGAVYQCDEYMRFNVLLSIHEDIPGAPNRMLTWTRWVGYEGGPSVYTHLLDIEGATCVPGGPPPAHPVYLRVKVRRMGKPGAVWVATRSIANPCPKGSSPGTDWVDPA